MPDAPPTDSHAPADDAGGDAKAKIGEADVRHVAKLARLSLTDADVSRLTHQLGTILDYVGQIGEVDVEGVEPMATAVAMKNVLRDDVAGEALTVEQVLRNAPDSDPPFFKVPKVIGGDEDSAG